MQRASGLAKEPFQLMLKPWALSSKTLLAHATSYSQEPAIQPSLFMQRLPLFGRYKLYIVQLEHTHKVMIDWLDSVLRISAIFQPYNGCNYELKDNSFEILKFPWAYSS